MLKKIMAVLMAAAVVVTYSGPCLAHTQDVQGKAERSKGSGSFSVEMETAESAGDAVKAVVKTSGKVAKKSKEEGYKEGIASYIRSKNKKISKKKARKMAGYFVKYGKKYGVDPIALVAIGYHESRFKAKAYNPNGFYGVMQTSSIIGRNAGLSTKQLYKPKNSIKAAAKYFKYNLKYFKGSYKKAYAGYCFGTGGAKRGQYNKSVVKKRLKTRKKIKKYLVKHNFI